MAEDVSGYLSNKDAPPHWMISLCINDGLCVYGKREEEQNHNLQNLMVCQQNSIVFNSHRCQDQLTRVHLWWDHFSMEIMMPDLQKIQKMTKMSPPMDVQQLLPLIGMIKLIQPYVLKILPTTSLCKLLKWNERCCWDDNTNVAFQKLTFMLITAQWTPLQCS